MYILLHFLSVSHEKFLTTNSAEILGFAAPLRSALLWRFPVLHLQQWLFGLRLADASGGSSPDAVHSLQRLPLGSKPKTPEWNRGDKQEMHRMDNSWWFYHNSWVISYNIIYHHNISKHQPGCLIPVAGFVPFLWAALQFHQPSRSTATGRCSCEFHGTRDVYASELAWATGRGSLRSTALARRGWTNGVLGQFDRDWKPAKAIDDGF